MLMKIRQRLLCALVVGSVLAGFGEVRAEWEITWLGDLGGSSPFYQTRAYGVNNLGQVTGASYDSHGIERAFIYKDGVMSVVGGSGDYQSRGYSINDLGQVAGEYSPGFSANWHPALMSGDTLVSGYGSFGMARGIDNSGVLVGGSYSESPLTTYPEAFVTEGGVVQYVGADGWQRSHLMGVNGNGDAVGSADGYFVGHLPVTSRAIVVTDGVATVLDAPDGRYAYGNAINNSKQVAGLMSDAEGYWKAVLYTDGTPQLLGDPNGNNNSEALGINNEGHVVGYSIGDGGYVAFLWTPEQGMLDLNSLLGEDSGWHLYQATGINDHGQIVGFGTKAGSSGLQAFLLSPTSLSAVPEPSTLALAGLGIGGMVMRARRRRAGMAVEQAA